MFCAECDRPVNLEVDHYFANGDPEPFWICRDCETKTAADWEEDKKMLREQGHQIPCDFFERIEAVGPDSLR